MSEQIGGVSVDLSALLQAWGRGDLRARDQLTPVAYAELRRRAAAYLRHERPNHTLQPTALVHEAYVRLIGQVNTCRLIVTYPADGIPKSSIGARDLIN